MTLKDLQDLLASYPYADKQVIITMGHRKFKIVEMHKPMKGNAEAIEIKLEEVKE